MKIHKFHGESPGNRFVAPNLKYEKESIETYTKIAMV
jgi:hypothetical protein